MSAPTGTGCLCKSSVDAARLQKTSATRWAGDSLPLVPSVGSDDGPHESNPPPGQNCHAEDEYPEVSPKTQSTSLRVSDRCDEGCDDCYHPHNGQQEECDGLPEVVDGILRSLDEWRRLVRVLLLWDVVLPEAELPRSTTVSAEVGTFGLPALGAVGLVLGAHDDLLGVVTTQDATPPASYSTEGVRHG